MSWETLSTVLFRPMLPAVAAGLVILVMRVRHPASKHLIWAAALVAMLLVPIVSYVAPHWDLPVLPSKPAPVRAVIDTPAPASLEFSDESPMIAAAPVATAPRKSFRLPMVAWVYLSGLAAFSLYRLLGWVLLRRVLARSTPLMGRTVRESGDVTSPVAVGALRPTVLLPLEWREWSAATRRAVLAHEFAHLRRRDTVVSALGRLVTSLMWFHPLVWWLAGHMEELAEQACDAVALESCGDPGGYSRILVAFANALNQTGYRVAVPGLAMAARPSVLGKRIDRVFELADGNMRKLAWPGAVAGLIGLPVMCLAAMAGVTASENLLLPALRPKVPEAPQVKIAAQVRTQTAPIPQAAPAVDPNLTFEVASVRMVDPVEPGTNGGFRITREELNSGHIWFSNAAMFQILARFLGFQEDQIVGPDWVTQPYGAERYDLQVSARPGSTPQEIAVMMRNLLKERFHLAYHMEKRNLDAYELVVAKGGAKLTPARIPAELPVAPTGQPLPTFRGDDGYPNLPAGWPYIVGAAENSQMAMFLPVRRNDEFVLVPPRTLVGKAVWRVGFSMVTIPQFILWVREFDAIQHVVDRTGLAGKYDIRLRFGPEAGSEDSDPAPDIFEALEKQLGLKLEKTKAPYDVMVIDHIDKTPVEN